MAATLASNDLYGGVVVSALAMVVEYFLIMEIACIINRKRHFSKTFMDQHFGEMHREAFGTEIKGGGYPDHGSGRYAEKLDYKSWVQFANSQRSYYNFLEAIFMALFCLFIAGLHYPVAAIIEAVVYMVGRLFYAIGYNSNKGATGRIIGALVGQAGFLSLFVTAILSTLRIAGAY